MAVSMVARIGFTFILLTMLTSNGIALASQRWVACGDAELRFYEITDSSINEVERLLLAELEVPSNFSAARNLDGLVECKPVNNGREILITSWKGGVARLDVPANTVNFLARVPHAHSAELLPGNRIVFVGNSLLVFDESDGTKPIIEMALDDGHGLFWNDQNSILYVLSEDYLEVFALQDWSSSNPKLRSLGKNRLPGQSDGHDLSLASDGRLLVSTRDGVWFFDPSNSQFTPYPELNPLFRAQSVVESGGLTVWVQAEESWWGRGFFIKAGNGPAKRLDTPDIRLYKVRSISNSIHQPS